MIPYEEFRREVERRRRERWLRIVAGEPPGRPPGRRPRDAAKEKILVRLDRARLARRGLISRRRPVVDEPSGER